MSPTLGLLYVIDGTFFPIHIDSQGVVYLKRNKNFLVGIMASIGMIVLILDTKTAIAGAKEGIQLCLYSIIPTLLPFCVLSKLINAYSIGKEYRFLQPVGKVCGIPKGAETVLLTGILGGYPIGAQCLNDVYKCGATTSEDATRMLAFCNNAGPAFIFGILGSMFQSNWASWGLLCIHIASALAVGALLPKKSVSVCKLPQKSSLSLPKIIEESVKSMSIVSAWIILFRILLLFCQRWFIWLIPQSIQIIVSGTLELANGCIALSQVQNAGLRFIVASAFLAFGGICVAMQTLSVTKNIGHKLYFPGKLLQTAFSILFATFAQYLIFSPGEQFHIPLSYFFILCCIVICLLIVVHNKKKTVAFAE